MDNWNFVAEQTVMKYRRKYISHWRTRGNLYWFTHLVEEVIELGFSLVGLHKDPPELELKQIASICINWLEHRSEATNEN